MFQSLNNIIQTHREIKVHIQLGLCVVVQYQRQSTNQLIKKKDLVEFKSHLNENIERSSACNLK